MVKPVSQGTGQLPGIHISPETINAVPNRRPGPDAKNATGIYLGAVSTHYFFTILLIGVNKWCKVWQWLLLPSAT